jgi:hypothetical protein
VAFLLSQLADCSRKRSTGAGGICSPDGVIAVIGLVLYRKLGVGV